MTRHHRDSEYSSEVHDFFDFYSMYELYMRVGGFRENGYSSYDTFVNEDIFDRIKYKYEEVIETFYENIHTALIDAIKSEYRHYPFECKTFLSYKADGDTPEFYKYVTKRLGITKDMSDATENNIYEYAEHVYKLFQKLNWNACYGGKKWAKAVKLLIESKSIKTLHEKVGWCDKVLDLQHNSGHLLDKTHFTVLSDCFVEINGKDLTPLDFRFKSKNIIDFLPYNSHTVKKLVIPRQNLFV